MARNKRKCQSPDRSLVEDSQLAQLPQLLDAITRLSTEVARLAATVRDQQQQLNRLQMPGPPSDVHVGARETAGHNEQVMLCSVCANSPGNVNVPVRPNSFVGDLSRTRPELSNVLRHISVAHSAVQMQEKARNAVIEKLPEPADLNTNRSSIQRSITDKMTVDNICVDLGIPIPIDVWRQPSKGVTRARPVKVKFSSNVDRDSFIRGFRRVLPTASRVPGQPMPSARRDMTPPELELLREIRSEVYSRNKAAGCNAYYVHDLEIFETADKYRRSFSPTPPSA